MLEPLGAVTTGSQFLEPDGNIPVTYIYIYIGESEERFFCWEQACFQIIFLTRRIRKP